MSDPRFATCPRCGNEIDVYKLGDAWLLPHCSLDCSEADSADARAIHGWPNRIDGYGEPVLYAEPVGLTAGGSFIYEERRGWDAGASPNDPGGRWVFTEDGQTVYTKLYRTPGWMP